MMENINLPKSIFLALMQLAEKYPKITIKVKDCYLWGDFIGEMKGCAHDMLVSSDCGYVCSVLEEQIERRCKSFQRLKKTKFKPIIELIHYITVGHEQKYIVIYGITAHEKPTPEQIEEEEKIDVTYL